MSQLLDIEQARFNMIEQQVRTWDVLDQRVLDTMKRISRENFVPEQYRSLAFADTNILLGHEQVMMAPKVEGRVLQALNIQPQDSILEIGTGSGYLTACLAGLGKHVTSIEILEDFTASAATKLADNEITNITLETGDASDGIHSGKQYDVIAVTGSVPLLGKQFQESLKPGGRLFVITGTLPIMEAFLIQRVDANSCSEECLFETCLPPLLHAASTQDFVF